MSDSETRNDTARFVASLPAPEDFASAIGTAAYVAVPDDWLVAVTDVVESRKAIAAGRYKAVNMAGVSVISAAMNALDSREIPFVFGGDGAALVMAPAERGTVAAALASVATFAAEELELELRAAIVPVSKIRNDGFDVRLKAVRLSDFINNYAFSGGGISHAEKLMKAGEYRIGAAPAGTRPDLTGLSCRWTPISEQGRHIVSVIIEPGKNVSDTKFAKAALQIMGDFDGTANQGNPMPPQGPGVSWPVEGVGLEARAQRKDGNLFISTLKLYASTLFAWLIFKTGMKVGDFEPEHYKRQTSANTDFRKVQDGLRMTLSLDDETLAALEADLERKREAGVIRYGLCRQDSAVLTCFVPSVMEDDHFHFLDGAGGGYAQAASNMRA